MFFFLNVATVKPWCHQLAASFHLTNMHLLYKKTKQFFCFLCLLMRHIWTKGE